MILQFKIYSICLRLKSNYAVTPKKSYEIRIKSHFIFLSIKVIETKFTQKDIQTHPFIHPPTHPHTHTYIHPPKYLRQNTSKHSVPYQVYHSYRQLSKIFPRLFPPIFSPAVKKCDLVILINFI